MPSVRLPSDVTFAVVSAKFVILEKKRNSFNQLCFSQNYNYAINFKTQ